ncbi:hypothetical protein [uncultured Desulfosarcina sp.]|uniref:hypothetical protein n=1 Tax=uncultured Desulfosarcina sp. TaxID=218289 RepID=UPI0029C61D85|nr:hypothetical protein [uncultured Desulfosarcina sp.]
MNAYKNRILIIQLKDGLEAQKKYANEIKENAYSHGILPFITHYISYRLEPAITPTRFMNLIDDIMSKNSVSFDLESFIRYHLIPGYVPNVEDLPILLVWDAFGTLIDYYNSLVNLFFIYCSRNLSSETINKIAPKKKLVEKLNSKKLTIFNEVFFESDEKIAIEKEEEEIFILYLNKQYEQLIERSLNLLSVHPNNFNIIDLVSRALSFKADFVLPDSNKLYIEIIKLMKSVILKDEDYYSSISELFKIAWNYISSSWSKSLLSFCIKEFSDDPLNGNHAYSLYSIFHNNRVPITRLPDITNRDLKKKYIKYFRKHFANVEINKYFDLCIEEDACILEEVTNEEMSLLEGIKQYSKGNYKIALEHANKLLVLKKPYYSNQAIRIIANSLLETKKIEQAIEFSVNCYLNDHKIINYLPLSKIVNLYREQDLDLSFNINLPILLDVYVKQGNTKWEYLRPYAYEDFLISQGFEKPSELINRLDEYDHSKLIYFLKEICIEIVMDNSEFFDHSDEVPEERINVCSQLIDLDSENSHEYQLEIKNIISRLTIKNRLREIEKSKIYVDIESIHAYAEKNLKENFERYISFLKDGIDKISFKFPLDEKLSAKNTDLERLLKTILPDNEKNSLFESMILDLRDQFVSSTEHGLDGYLSVRIRHGTLSSHLRSPLEENNLITQKAGETGKYADNQFWINKYKYLGPNLTKEISNYLNEFSRSFDDLIDELNNEWIQVRTNSDQKGFFDFSIYKSQISALSSIINSETEFNAFISIVDTFLLEILNLSLDNIRNRLREFAKFKAVGLLTELQSKISQNETFENTTELSDAISKGKTEIQRAFDRIIEWFHFSESQKDKPFTIEEALTISEKTIKVSNRRFSINKDINNDILNINVSGNLTVFVDMLILMYGNIIKHSNIDTYPNATITISTSDKYLLIKVVNEIEKYVYNTENILKIEKLKKLVVDRGYGEAIKKEGGTGFHKLYKIINHDIKFIGETEKGTLDFGYLDQDKFFVEVGIPILYLE